MDHKLIKLEKHEYVTKVLLNHPSKKNALDDEMIIELVSILDELNKDSSCRVVLLGSLNNVFCSGGDIKAMLDKKEMFEGGSIELREQYHFGIQEISRAMERFRKPIVAVLDGACIGAGADLACMCDMRIGSDKLFFAETFSNLALVPGDGGTFFLSRVIGYSKAMELYLTARPVKAKEAHDIGLINFIEDSEKVWNRAMTIASDIASKPPVSIEMTKQALKETFQNRNLESNLNLLSAFQGITQMSDDHQRGLKNLKSKREKFEGN
jgi:2-(1,2-epoxy-1,2-dihydrophenyl)acetyl-CoA isomerase